MASAYGQADALVKQIREFDVLELAKGGRNPLDVRGGILNDANAKLPGIEVALPQLLSYFAALEQEKAAPAVEVLRQRYAEAVGEVDRAAGGAKRKALEIAGLVSTAQVGREHVTPMHPDVSAALHRE